MFRQQFRFQFTPSRECASLDQTMHLPVYRYDYNTHTSVDGTLRLYSLARGKMVASTMDLTSAATSLYCLGPTASQPREQESHTMLHSSKMRVILVYCTTIIEVIVNLVDSVASQQQQQQPSIIVNRRILQQEEAVIGQSILLAPSAHDRDHRIVYSTERLTKLFNLTNGKEYSIDDCVGSLFAYNDNCNLVCMSNQDEPEFLFFDGTDFSLLQSVPVASSVRLDLASNLLWVGDGIWVSGVVGINRFSARRLRWGEQHSHFTRAPQVNNPTLTLTYPQL
eukprot:m.203505 g.203505  ORF g.203505 m.203505 type:complete len:280 (+) comp14992_c0_seq11:1148-1987(+)